MSPTSLQSPEASTLEAWLAEVQYQPGSQLHIHEDLYLQPPHNLVMVVMVTVEDTYRPGTQIQVAHRKPVLPWVITKKEEFIRWVASCLEEVAVHESREWFKWRDNGRPVNDPHKSDQQP